MKKWQETQLVFERLAELLRAGQRVALATVVRVRGSAYRREGAKMLIAEDGGTVGSVSGGCLEQDVREVALEVLRSGRPKLRRYCSGADDVGAWDMGLGCDGEIEIYVEPVREDRAHERALLKGDVPFTLTTAITGERRLFVDVFEPPPKLVLMGAGEDARPLARLGVEIGFRVTVVDRRSGLLTLERFPDSIRRVAAEAEELTQIVPFDERTYVVLMTHRYADDARYLRALIFTNVPYIGILGPAQRTARLLDALPEDACERSRIYAPVGLDVGSEGAEQVALAILAELLAVHSGRRGTSLRERASAIHVGTA